MSVLRKGSENRRLGETNMNRESSRSHAVFTCTMEAVTRQESGLTNVRYSRINLIDLAGDARHVCLCWCHLLGRALDLRAAAGEALAWQLSRKPRDRGSCCHLYLPWHRIGC